MDAERVARINQDVRWGRIWALGGVLHDPQRPRRIAAAQDWRRLLTPALDEARAIYAQWVAPNEPLSAIHGYRDGVPFSASLKDLRAVWHEQGGRRG